MFERALSLHTRDSDTLDPSQVQHEHEIVAIPTSVMPRVYPPIEGKSDFLSPSLIESTAGFTAGIVSTLVAHPFDVVKTRLQGTSHGVPEFLLSAIYTESPSS